MASASSIKATFIAIMMFLSQMLWDKWWIGLLASVIIIFLVEMLIVIAGAKVASTGIKAIKNIADKK